MKEIAFILDAEMTEKPSTRESVFRLYGRPLQQVLRNDVISLHWVKRSGNEAENKKDFSTFADLF